MHHHRGLDHCGLAAIFLAAALAPLPSLAVDVDFTGTVTSTCSFTNVRDGIITLDSRDNTSRTMSSAITGGRQGIVTIVANADHDVTVSPGTLRSDPVGYNTDNATITISTGRDGNFVAGPKELDVTPATRSIDIDVLLTSTTPLVPGDYVVEVTVTCAPSTN